MTYKSTNASGVQKIAFRELMKGVYTCVPGHVTALIAGGAQQRAQVRVGVVRVEINGAEVSMPPITDVPVLFPGDDYAVEYEITPGCEGMIYFSQRCVDGWKNTGGVAQNPLARFHDLQDAFFVPGFRSLPNVLPAFANNGIRLRNKSGSQFVWLKNDNTIVADNGVGSVTVSPDGAVSVVNGAGNITLGADGIVNINGVTITPEGQISVPSGGGISGSNGIEYETHRHNETGTITGGPIA